MKGIGSHAYLVIQMKTTDDGYQLTVIDSNYPLDSLTTNYHKGDHFLTVGKFDFVPYVGFQNDFKKIFSALQSTCKKSYFNSEEIPAGDIELENGENEHSNSSNTSPF